jgi:hypothetical protein
VEQPRCHRIAEQEAECGAGGRAALSVRAFDERGWMLEAAIVNGKELEACIERLFETPQVAYLHAHFAKPGCYAARIER